jgi:hypothetical protein
LEVEDLGAVGGFLDVFAGNCLHFLAFDCSFVVLCFVSPFGSFVIVCSSFRSQLHLGVSFVGSPFLSRVSLLALPAHTLLTTMLGRSACPGALAVPFVEEGLAIASRPARPKPKKKL